MPRTLRLISWTPTSYSRSRINAVAPGAIYTDMSNLLKTDEGKSFILGMQALKRIGQPDDVGSVVAFLASQDARWITGATIRVDGCSKLRVWGVR
jgi:3-oxoacyl-[acyl-carrier protein] reductase